MPGLSNNAQRALEQVKNGLLVLYGADYFTDEEWFRIDHVIHKGRYVFTRGPATHMLDEPLMSFGDPLEDFSSPIDFSAQNGKATTSATEQTEQTGSSMSDFSIFESSTSTMSPAHQFADAETLSSHSPVTTPNTSESADVPRLPTGYTQAQLEESKAFRSSVQHKMHRDTETPSWNEITSHPTGLKSSQPREMSWGSEVGSEDTGSMQHSISTLALHDDPSGYRDSSAATSPPAAPTKEFYYSEYVKKYGHAPRSLGDYWQPNNPEYKGPNPSHARSVTSTTSAFSQRKPLFKASSSSSDKSEPLIIGETYFAIQDQVKTSKIQLELNQGDLVRIQNLVSGVTYVGLSLRTGARGQVKSSLLKPLSMSMTPSDSPSPRDKNVYATSRKEVAEPKQSRDDKSLQEVAASLDQQNSENDILDDEEPKEIAHSSRTPEAEHRKTGGHHNTVPSIDMIETLNAAEWDEEPKSKPASAKTEPDQPKKPEPVPAWESVTARRGKQGLPTSPIISRPTMPLSSSRFAVLADEGNNMQMTAAMQAAIDKGVREALGNQMDSIRKTLSPTVIPLSLSASRFNKSRNDPAPTLYAKTNTCWFWATNKGCRFTDEECRDLHSHTNALGQPTNFHNGKPTWGAAADYPTAPSLGAAPGGYRVPEDEKLTCWFWAEKGKCVHSDEDCKYAHRPTPGGVARPGTWKHPVARDSWRKPDRSPWDRQPEEFDFEVEDNNSVTETEVKSPTEEEEPSWDDQPAHLTDLQIRLQQEAVGW